MKIFSRVLVLVGLIVILVAGGLLLKNVIDINQLWAVANANRSTSFFNPKQEIILTTGVALIGGFLLGLGLSMPKR